MPCRLPSQALSHTHTYARSVLLAGEVPHQQGGGGGEKVRYGEAARAAGAVVAAGAGGLWAFPPCMCSLQIDLPRDWANLALYQDVWRGVAEFQAVMYFILSFPFLLAFEVGLGFDFCVFVAGWRHALRSEWPFIIIIIIICCLYV